jgi:hypothetical protein
MKTKPNKTFAFVVAAFSLVAIGPAFADDQKPRQQGCAFTDRLRSWKDVDNFTAILEMGFNKRYKVTFFNDCREMKWAVFAKVESRPGLCLSSGDRITFGRRPGIASTCVIQSIEKLPPREPTPASDRHDQD